MRSMDLLECAEFLKVDRTTAMKLAQRGEIVGARVGRAWVFLEDDVVAFLRKTAQQQTLCRLQGLGDATDHSAPSAISFTLPDRRRPGRKARMPPALP